MESWMTSLVAGMFSSLIVGVIMSVFQKALNKSVTDAKEATDQKFKNLGDKLDALSARETLIEAKVDLVEEKVGSLTYKTGVIGNDVKHVMKDVADLKDVVKDKLRMPDNFGKVIKK